MRRREFITLLGGAAPQWPLRLEAQQKKRSPRIAMLVAIAETDPQAPLRMAAIRDESRERGWSEIQIDTRFSAGDAQRLRGYAAELLDLKPDVFFAGNTSALAAVFKETRTLPIVFAQVDDPVASGFVASLSRPGGNVTGFSSFEESFPGKWLELLKQLAPRVSRVAFLYDPANPAGPRSLDHHGDRSRIAWHRGDRRRRAGFTVTSRMPSTLSSAPRWRLGRVRKPKHCPPSGTYCGTGCTPSTFPASLSYW